MLHSRGRTSEKPTHSFHFARVISSIQSPVSDSLRPTPEAIAFMTSSKTHEAVSVNHYLTGNAFNDEIREESIERLLGLRHYRDRPFFKPDVSKVRGR